MAITRASGTVYQTRLSPPPADPSCCHGELREYVARDNLRATPRDTRGIGNRSWEYAISDEADVRLLLAAILQQMGQQRPSGEVRWAFLYAAQPDRKSTRLNSSH